MHSDQRQPGWAVRRAALTLPRSTTSSCVLSGERVSSGESKLFTVMPAIPASLCHMTDLARVVPSCDWALQESRRAGDVRFLPRLNWCARCLMTVPTRYTSVDV